MNLLLSPYSDAFYNLALEEYLFEHIKADFILLYVNRDAVVVGKHQNTVAEVNSRFLFENEVPVIRRFSGGGTVYHDEGNINFSFISTGENSKVIDFKRYANPVVYFLKSMGIRATLSDRNDILIDGYKISGHAAHAKNTRSLHHGTLLYNADLQKLSEGLRVSKDKFKSRGVQSVKSKVANIQQYIKHKLDINEFVEHLAEFLGKEFPVDGFFDLQEADRKEIAVLVENKYKSFDWNYGYGPEYSFSPSFELDGETVSMDVGVVQGRITSLTMGKKSIFTHQFEKLIETRHFWPDVIKTLSEGLGPERAEQVIQHFF